MPRKPVNRQWQTIPIEEIVMCLHGKTIHRKHIRYRLFRIREGKTDYDKGLKTYIENQFRPGMTWENFTFDWDVAPMEPLKVITPFEWQTHGGQMESLDAKTTICRPAAFTRQCMCVGYPCKHHGPRHGGA